MMQHRNIAGDLINIREFAEFKQEKQRRDMAIRISHLGMASKRIVADYPHLAGWYCLRVKDRHEAAVEKALQDEGVIALVVKQPEEIVVRRGRQWTVPERPWMPGYVLVRVVPSAAAFDGLRKVKGVLSVVGNDIQAYKIPDEVIEKFQAFVLQVVAQRQERKAKQGEFLKGEIVRVIDGPFASFEGVVIDDVTKGADRIKCEVSIFGRSTPLDLLLASVEKV